jgi:uncharacterized protein
MHTPKELLAECVDNEVLHLILMPTEACNFRCTYCYEDFRLGRMQPRIVRGVKNLLSLRAPSLRLLNLTWFGGEPLLALDVLKDILLHARTLVGQYPEIQFASDITTNAYALSRSVFERLLDLGVTQFQIALDGPREWHDRKRVLAGGRGTFDRIWANLLATRSVPREFRIVVRLHVDRENHAALPPFIAEYGEHFGRDERFRLFLRKLSRFGGPNDQDLPVLAHAEASDILAGLSHCVVGNRTAALEQPQSPVCYAAKANSFLVRADGRLNKCTISLEHPSNQVGRLLEDGHVDLSPAMMQDWMRGLWSGDSQELGCPLHGLGG